MTQSTLLWRCNIQWPWSLSFFMFTSNSTSTSRVIHRIRWNRIHWFYYSHINLSNFFELQRTFCYSPDIRLYMLAFVDIDSVECKSKRLTSKDQIIILYAQTELFSKANYNFVCSIWILVWCKGFLNSMFSLCICHCECYSLTNLLSVSLNDLDRYILLPQSVQ